MLTVYKILKPLIAVSLAALTLLSPSTSSASASASCGPFNRFVARYSLDGYTLPFWTAIRTAAKVQHVEAYQFSEWRLYPPDSLIDAEVYIDIPRSLNQFGTTFGAPTQLYAQMLQAYRWDGYQWNHLLNHWLPVYGGVDGYYCLF